MGQDKALIHTPIVIAGSEDDIRHDSGRKVGLYVIWVCECQLSTEAVDGWQIASD
jgi:hypothetical protein